MSEQKKYLGKKRHKIFSIEKNYTQKFEKKISKTKLNLSPIYNLIPSEEIPTSNPYKFNLNLNENDDNIGIETKKHSLIGISKLVFEYLKTIIHTTGNEVTEHIKNIFKSKKNDQSNQKNIQRRVYDAINVMCAVGLIRKNKQEIQFLKKNNQQSNIIRINKEIDESQKKEEDKNDDIDEKVKEKMDELEEKRKKLIKNYLTLKFYEKYSQLNETYPQRKFQKKLEFPFDLIKYDNSSPIKIISKEDNSRYLILSNSKFVHLTPYDIIKKLISSDILLKINESSNNMNENKSNSKKSTNDNSILEEINSNINNNSLFNIEQEEKKVEESPKKNNHFSETHSKINYIIPDEQVIKKDKEEKEDNIVFDYLKNLKCFVDELEDNNVPQSETKNLEINDTNKIQEEPINIFENENDNENAFHENEFRKNSNLSYVPNFYDENEIKKNKGDMLSDIDMFM